VIPETDGLNAFDGDRQAFWHYAHLVLLQLTFCFVQGLGEEPVWRQIQTCHLCHWDAEQQVPAQLVGTTITECMQQ
jgi:hypothetical protein